MKDARRCWRKWMLGYYARWKRKGEPLAGAAYTIGNRVHDALAYYYAGKGDPVEFAKVKAIEDAEKSPPESKEIKKEMDLVLAMLEGYVQWLEEEGLDQDLEVIASETKVEVPLADTGINLLAKLDARVKRHSTGAKLSLEHKTVDNLKESPSLALDTQLLTQHLGEFLSRKSEDDVADGSLYNMLRKVKRTARSNPPYYHRVEIHHSTEELRNHWYHVLSIGFAILDKKARLDAGENHQIVCPPNPTRDCKWDCPFLEPCKMMNRGEDYQSFLGDFYEVVDPLERYWDAVTVDGE